MTTPLQQAATALMDAMGKTYFTCRLGEQLDALEKALEAEQAQAVEPIGYIRHADKTFWPHPECAVYASVSPSLAPVYAHPAPPVEQAQAVEPLIWVRKDQLNQMASGFLLSAYRSTEGRTDLTPVFARPAPPPAEAKQVAVPMTEAQIFACDPVPHEMFDQQRIDFARAIEAFHKIGAKPEAGISVSETKVRPQNCGTGYCSCIECPYPKTDGIGDKP